MHLLMLAPFTGMNCNVEVNHHFISLLGANLALPSSDQQGEFSVDFEKMITSFQ